MEVTLVTDTAPLLADAVKPLEMKPVPVTVTATALFAATLVGDVAVMVGFGSAVRVVDTLPPSAALVKVIGSGPAVAAVTDSTTWVVVGVPTMITVPFVDVAASPVGWKPVPVIVTVVAVLTGTAVGDVDVMVGAASITRFAATVPPSAFFNVIGSPPIDVPLTDNTT